MTNDKKNEKIYYLTKKGTLDAGKYNNLAKFAVYGTAGILSFALGGPVALTAIAGGFAAINGIKSTSKIIKSANAQREIERLSAYSPITADEQATYDAAKAAASGLYSIKDGVVSKTAGGLTLGTGIVAGIAALATGGAAWAAVPLMTGGLFTVQSLVSGTANLSSAAGSAISGAKNISIATENGTNFEEYRENITNSLKGHYSPTLLNSFVSGYERGTAKARSKFESVYADEASVITEEPKKEVQSEDRKENLTAMDELKQTLDNMKKEIAEMRQGIVARQEVKLEEQKKRFAEISEEVHTAVSETVKRVREENNVFDDPNTTTIVTPYGISKSLVKRLPNGGMSSHYSYQSRGIGTKAA